jgi:ribosomal protein S18 acetylase RimI-like enzyme
MRQRAVARVLQAVQRHGVAGATRRLLGRLSRRESHVWYRLEVGAPRPRIDLLEGLQLRRGTRSELSSVSSLYALTLDEGFERFDAGAELWLVVDAALLVVFACWIYHRLTPALAAPGGLLALPPDTVCLEDSVTAREYRGRGVAPAAWTKIADRLQAEGARRIITKVGTDNVPSQKAVEKAGFRPIAEMRLVTLGPFKHVDLHPFDGDPVAEHLRRVLGSSSRSDQASTSVA